MTIHQEDYTVRIDAFQGPLDLLLYLIRRAEVDITDIPVAEITKQYLRFLKDVELIDIDEAGEFLVMAATLMEIKSRMLMPPEKKAGDSNGKEFSPTIRRPALIRRTLATNWCVNSSSTNDFAMQRMNWMNVVTNGNNGFL